MQLSTRITRTVAAAMSVAALAVAVSAGSASAAPIDLFKISPLGGLTQFGTNCQTTGAPLTEAALDWKQVGATVTPEVTGDICIQAPSNAVRAQVILDYYNNSHVLVASRPSVIKTGSGGLSIRGISRGGLPFNSATVNHVHVRLLDDRGTGVLHDVGSVALDL